MDYLKAETTISGVTAEQLQECGLVNPGKKELAEVVILKAITKWTQHPLNLPAPLGTAMAYITGNFSVDEYKEMKKSEKKEKVKLDNGRILTLHYMECPKAYKKNDGKNRLIIMCHGFQSVRTFMLHYYASYKELGFDVLLYDQRGHWEGRKYPCTMGYYEAEDLVDIAKIMRERLGEDAVIGVHGESMGSGIGAFAMNRVSEYTDFTVLDCGYSTMDAMARHVESLFFFFDKEPMNKAADLMSASDGGAPYSWVDGLGEIAKTPEEYPAYFVHGATDIFVSTHFSKDMYNAKRGERKLEIFPIASHAMSQMFFPGKYKRILQDWLRSYGLN